jgi:regulator of protease activity HflC (stomatin/prohibitin superfamily)
MDAKEIVELTRAAQRNMARPTLEHVSLGVGLRLVIFVVVGGALAGASWLILPLVAVPVGFVVAFLVALWASRLVRVAAQWEAGVILRFGRFLRVSEPGIVIVFPIADTIRFVDTRLLTLDIPHQQVITRDNVPVMVDGVIFFKVNNAETAVISVQDYRYAVSQNAQAALRDVIGSMTLDELLSEREQIQQQISAVVESHTRNWGIHVDAIRLLDINMPEDLKRMMSRQASAEREKRATITKAEGDREAAVNLAAAATTMATSPGAMQLRTLQSLDGLGSSPSNTVVLAVPVEVLEALRNTPAALVRGARAGEG